MNKIVYSLLSVLPDKAYIKLQYRYLTGKKLNLKAPSRYNEKLQWLKLYDHNPEYTKLVDKFLVKEFVAEKIGAKYIIPTLGVWNKAEDINFENLPEKFVLKCNHDSKSVFICKNKAFFDRKQAIITLNKAMKRNHFMYGREWPYKNVKPLIIAEKYMEDETGGLQDYKVMCFNGKAKLVQVHRGRFTDHYTHDIYDTAWVHQNFNQKGEVNAETLMPKPIFLDEMLKLSESLAKGIPHIRVDWYYVDHQLYFGELTFFDASGYLDFEPDELNEVIGSWIELPGKS